MKETQKEMSISASKDTSWVYPSSFNPLKKDTKILVTIEANLDAASYIMVKNMSSKSITVYNTKKEVKTNVQSKRVVPKGLSKTYFFENYIGPSQFTYQSKTSRGHLDITTEEVESTERAPLGFILLQGTYQKQVINQSTLSN
ncbi:hypothetical protein LC612_41980 [Nostoc sp. CHAB 5834]|nr:hypothetical protein [Nostoc sp. CHAB 5834]